MNASGLCTFHMIQHFSYNIITIITPPKLFGKKSLLIHFGWYEFDTCTFPYIYHLLCFLLAGNCRLSEPSRPKASACVKTVALCSSCRCLPPSLWSPALSRPLAPPWGVLRQSPLRLVFKVMVLAQVGWPCRWVTGGYSTAISGVKPTHLTELFLSGPSCGWHFLLF